MKQILIYAIAQWLVVGCVFSFFYAMLAKRITLTGFLRELFWWPRRVWIGAKAIYQNMGKVDFSSE